MVKSTGDRSVLDSFVIHAVDFLHFVKRNRVSFDGVAAFAIRNCSACDSELTY